MGFTAAAKFPLISVLVWLLSPVSPAEGDRANPALAHANFIKHPNTILELVNKRSMDVADQDFCALSCLADASCVSYNVATEPNQAGGYECQVLGEYQYSQPRKVKRSDQFHHHEMEVRSSVN